MDGWVIFAWCAVCVGGALVFMTIVSNEIQRIVAGLEMFNKQERTRLQRRIDSTGGAPSGSVVQEVEEVVESEAA